MDIQFRKYTETAVIPSYLDEIRYTFQSDEEVTIPPNECLQVSTGVGFTLPNNLAAMVYPFPGAGIYSIYFPRFITGTGDEPLKLRVINLGDEPKVIHRGQSLMKMLLIQIVTHEGFPFIKLNDSAITPSRSEGSAGWAIKSPIDCTIQPGGSEDIPSGISTPLLPGYQACVYPVHEYCVTNYFVEPDTEFIMRLVNSSDEPINIKIGDDLGLFAISEVIDVEVIEEPMQNPPRTFILSPIKRRG